MSINNQSNANVQILDQLILVSLDGTSITTGRRKLKKKISVLVLICHLMLWCLSARKRLLTLS